MDDEGERLRAANAANAAAGAGDLWAEERARLKDKVPRLTVEQPPLMAYSEPRQASLDDVREAVRQVIREELERFFADRREDD
jgi:hypothetical protein